MSLLMPVLLLPDLFAIAFLTLVLLLTHRKYKHEDGGLRTAGLFLIVLECVAHLCYAMALPRAAHHAAHAIALVAYLLAGMVFLRAADPCLRNMPYSRLDLAANACFPVALATAYGIDVRSRLLFGTLSGLGLAVGLALAPFHRGWRTVAILCGLWLPVIIAAGTGSFRQCVYGGLALLYTLVAFSFLKNLERASKGRLLIAAGFFAWALCFATHPWVADWGATFVQLASQIWDLPKFLITLGFFLELLERQVRQNEWLALHDQLTGMPNRRLYQDRLAQAVARAERDGTALILFNMDLDGFKTVNDTLGHDAGDDVLRQIGQHLQKIVRKTDTLARIGGDEFTLLAVDMPSPLTSQTGTRRTRQAGNSIRGAARSAWQPGRMLRKAAGTAAIGRSAPIPSLRHHADRIAIDLRVAVEQPLTLPLQQGGQALHISTSIGFAIYPDDTTDIAELCRLADRRMYRDKQERAQRSHERGISLPQTATLDAISSLA